MNIFIFLIGVLILIASIVYLIVSLIKKKFNKKAFLTLLILGLVLPVVGIAITPSTKDKEANTYKTTENKQKVKNEEKAKDKKEERIQEQIKGENEVKEDESKNSEEENNKKQTNNETRKVNKEDLKANVEALISKDVKGNAYAVDILTPTQEAERGYIVSIQVDNKNFSNEETCKIYAKELLMKLRNIENIHSIDMNFIADFKLAYGFIIEDARVIKTKENPLDGVNFQKF